MIGQGHWSGTLYAIPHEGIRHLAPFQKFVVLERNLYIPLIKAFRGKGGV